MTTRRDGRRRCVLHGAYMPIRLALRLTQESNPWHRPQALARTWRAARVQTVEMRASEFRFDLEPSAVKPGVIRFVVQNVGQLRHVLTVEWAGGAGASIRIAPGQTRALEVTLEQSSAYVFFCPLEDEGEGTSLIVHREKGMEGQLIVAKE